MSENISQQFKFMGCNAIDSSIIYGVFLIVWGLGVTQMSDSNSITSMIPTFLGLPVLFLSLLSKIIPSKQKLFMHIVVIFGLLSVIGGLDILRTIFAGFIFINFWADLSKLAMFFTGSLYCYICIQHFRYIKAMKK